MSLLKPVGHDVFIDLNKIKSGVCLWHTETKNFVSNCDIFVVIITPAALRSGNVEKEVRQAQSENKIIIPCLLRNVKRTEIKWNLDEIQGVEFNDKDHLVTALINVLYNLKLDFLDRRQPIEFTIVEEGSQRCEM